MGKVMDITADLIGQIYDAAFDSEVWPELLVAISDFCHVENAALVATDPNINYSSVITPRADPAVVNEYADYWWEFDPTAKATFNVPAGQITTLCDTGRDKFFASPFYNDYWRHSGLGAERIASNLFTSNGGFASFILQTSSGRDEITQETHQFFTFLIPHLVRSVNITRNLQRMAFVNGAHNCGYGFHQTGTVIVDAKRRVLFSDDAAEQIFAKGKQVFCVEGRIGFSDQRADATLTAVVAACAEARFESPAGDHIFLESGAKGTNLTVDIRPFRTAGLAHINSSPAAILVFDDPDRRRAQYAKVLQQRFEFTPAETKLAIEMLVGDGRAAAAQRCGISVNTARTQLSNIFEKANVKRQAQLINVLNELRRPNYTSSPTSS